MLQSNYQKHFNWLSASCQVYERAELLQNRVLQIGSTAPLACAMPRASHLKWQPEGECIMHPIDHYVTIRRGQEELRRRAEYERMVRLSSRNKRRTDQKGRQRVDNWLGSHMVSWGQKLERRTS